MNPQYIIGAKAEARPHGAIVVDGHQIADTIQCCHCGSHFVSVKGSGIDRGFCMLCKAVTCGKKECDPCYPFEKRMEDFESGKLQRL